MESIESINNSIWALNEGGERGELGKGDPSSTNISILIGTSPSCHSSLELGEMVEDFLLWRSVGH